MLFNDSIEIRRKKLTDREKNTAFSQSCVNIQVKNALK